MTDISGMRIRKKAFRFGVNKRYQNVEHFKVHKKQPIDVIKDHLKNILSPKKTEKKQKSEKQKTAKKPSFNFAIMGAGIVVAILLLLIGWIYISSQFQEQPAVFKPQLEKPSLDVWVLDGEVITSGEIRDENHIGAFTTDLSMSNVDEYTIEINTYKENLPTQIFILNSDRVEANTYPTFLRELRSILSKKNIILNEITIDQLETIPSGAMVIVPSGVVPKQLLGIDSATDFNDLVNRGVVFIYIGQPFSRMLDGNLVVSTPSEVSEELRFLSFNEVARLSSSKNFNLFQPLYQATARGSGWESMLLYGSVSVIKKGDGAVIYLPQTLDGGWRGDATLAAEDVSRFIFDYPWVTPTSSVKKYTDSDVNETLNLENVMFFTNSFSEDDCSVKMDISAESPASKYPLEETAILSLKKKARGELFIEEGYRVVPTNISNTKIRMNARLMEPEPAQPNMFLIITDNLGNEVERFPRGPVNVQQPDVPFDVPIYVDRGEYIVSFVDDAGKSYAHSYLRVVSIDIKQTTVRNQKNSEYIFDITMGGKAARLETVSVSVDDGEYGEYKFNDVSRVTVDVGKYTYDDFLPFGTHSFEFTAGGFNKKITVKREIPKNPLMDPLFLAVVILAGGIAFVGVYLARSEVINYAIDIPNFPPITRTKIPLPSDTILSIFSKINNNYRWKNTPLTISEVRNGFKDMFYKGRPIYVTDYNVEYLMDELIKRGLVASSLEYYCPISWTKKSNRDARYLAMMRKLRDICVNNAVPFTGLGESDFADSEINVVGQQMFVHFYSSSDDVTSMIKRSLSTVNKGITIILFRNHTEKYDFKSLLNSPFSGPLILKMETDSGSVLLHTLGEFRAMITDLKGL